MTVLSELTELKLRKPPDIEPFDGRPSVFTAPLPPYKWRNSEGDKSMERPPWRQRDRLLQALRKHHVRPRADLAV